MKALALCTLSLFVPASPPLAQSSQPTIYVTDQDGFQTAISAAFIKKHVSATVLTSKEDAQYTLLAAPVNSKEESTGGKVARCLFLDCFGMNGYSSVAVELIRNKDSAVVWA